MRGPSNFSAGRLDYYEQLVCGVFLHARRPRKTATSFKALGMLTRALSSVIGARNVKHGAPEANRCRLVVVH